METLTGFPQQQRPAVEPEPTAHDRSGVSSPDIGGRSDPEDDEPMASSAFSSSSISAPPYWLNATNNLPRMRGESSASTDSTPSGGIMLRDNETDSQDDRNSACWARGVEILDHTIVNGSATNIGAFVVWNVRVEALNGSFMNVRKRYSEFDGFRSRLVKSFPNFEAAVPKLPPKSLISKFQPKFLEKRRAGLQYFLNCIILNPEFSGSPVLKEFLFS